MDFFIKQKNATKKEKKDGNDKHGLAIVVGYNKAFDGHRFVYSTGIKVSRKGFNAANPGKKLRNICGFVEKAYESIVEDGSPLTNEALKTRTDLLRNRVAIVDKEIHLYTGDKIERRNVPDGINRTKLLSDVKAEFQKASPAPGKVIDSTISGGKNELFGFWQAVVDGKFKTKRGKKLSMNSVKAKKQTMNILTRYQEHANEVLTFDSMDMPFFQRFMHWMETVGKERTDAEGVLHREPYDVNSIAKNIKDVKAIMNLARQNRLTKNTEFVDWTTSKEPNEVVALEKDELLAIVDLKLSGTKDDVRDIFVLGCFLGPRISDYKSFKKENLKIVNGRQMFEYTQEKTGVTCLVPVHEYAQRILDKRDGDFPKMISEQNFRHQLKNVCKDAGLNSRVITKRRDNKPVYAKKWEAVTPHASRRTFATALFYGWFIEKPMPGAYCMLYTGHRSEKSFLLYINAKSKDLMERALEYFGVQPIMKVS